MLQRRGGLGLGTCIIALFSAACWMPLEQGRKLETDVQTLRDESRKTADEQRAQLTEQMARADEKIGQVEQALTDLNRASHSTSADLGVQLERLGRDLQELRGTLELTDYRLGKLEKYFEGDNSLEKRLEALEKQLKSGAAAQTPALAGEGEPKDKKALLAQAEKTAKAGKIDEARGVYRDIIKRWPNDIGVTDVALLRLGDLYYGEKRYSSALQEFVKVGQKFATSALVEEAYYKIGLCSHALGNLEDAKIFFTEVVKSHKSASLAKSAQAKLDEVNKQLERERQKSAPAKPSGKEGKK